MDEKYSSLCRSVSVVFEFVRFHPVLNNYKALGDIYDIVKLGKTISIRLGKKDQIWNDLTSPNRTRIRNAKKSGGEIFWGRDTVLFD